jgi:hypothetical protein
MEKRGQADYARVRDEVMKGMELRKPQTPAGAAETSRLLRMSNKLDQAAVAAAAEQGITVSEWWREVGRRALGIQEPTGSD